jgi:hypothetical protein
LCIDWLLGLHATNTHQQGLCLRHLWQPFVASRLSDVCSTRAFDTQAHCNTAAPVVWLQSVIGLAAFWVVLGGIVGVAGFNYVNSKQIKDQP